MFRRKSRLKVGLMILVAMIFLSASAFPIYASVTIWKNVSNLMETSPSESAENPPSEESIAAPAETPMPGLRTLTVTDEDLPKPPISGLAVHFLSPAEGDPGPGKIRANYGILRWSVWFGAHDGKLWLYHVPRRESLPWFLGKFYDYIGIDEHTVYTETDGKYWIAAIPPWLDIAKYDKDVTELPVVISAETRDGEATVTYMLRQDHASSLTVIGILKL